MHLAGMFFHPLFGFGFVLYFLPVIVALVKSRRDTLSICLLNLFLGWTFIGWVVALVWAFKPEAAAVAR